MASFDATSSAVPDSLLLARQADRLARQATNTVMQDTISRPALGDSSNTLSVEALVKQGGRAKAPRRVCHGCVLVQSRRSCRPLPGSAGASRGRPRVVQLLFQPE